MENEHRVCSMSIHAREKAFQHHMHTIMTGIWEKLDVNCIEKCNCDNHYFFVIIVSLLFLVGKYEVQCGLTLHGLLWKEWWKALRCYLEKWMICITSRWGMLDRFRLRFGGRLLPMGIGIWMMILAWRPMSLLQLLHPCTLSRLRGRMPFICPKISKP